jgi:hypothetical protein
MGTWELCVDDDGFMASEKAMIRKYLMLSLTVIPKPRSGVMWLGKTGLLTLYRGKQNRINGTER